MLNESVRMRQVLALLLAVAITAVVPVAAFADGKKHFKEGMKFEENMQWDKAAEKFALAVAEKPSNVEYRLHLQRSLVMAAIMLVERGDKFAEQKDYNAAYQAYRQAYSFDPTNELALIKMRNMLEVQGLPTDSLPKGSDPSGPSYKRPQAGPDRNLQASFTAAPNGAAAVNGAANGSSKVQLPGTRRYKKEDVVVRSDNLLNVIEHLAQKMGLNVIFDQQVLNQMRSTKLVIELRDVTLPRALEMILKTNNLMYSQLDTRTLVIAVDNPQARMRYEPLSVRTFYIKNADINDIRTAIQQTIKTKDLVPVKQLNALVARDTPSNLDLIESMIDSLDKTKAEVLIDVSIYEVSRTDLLQIGNQFRTTGDENNPLGLSNLGGIGQPGFLGLGPRTLTGPLGFALGLPQSTLSFFQDKGKAKLLASTQVHVIDTEQHTIRIGQRVPIQTATLPSFNVPTERQQRRAEQQTGLNQNDLFQGIGGFGGVGIPQIQYENVGLNIDMTPNVYEDEVQMKMKIESTSVDTSSGKLTPTFNQRTMSSVARIKDGQTTMIAGVSQTIESKNVRGIPLIGLIPILGRFFSTPETDNRQSDVVITVTPHILRRADIRPEDHLAKDAGTQQDATTQLTIEQILYLAEQSDAQQNQVAAAGGGGPSKPAETPPTDTKVMVPTADTNRAAPPGVVVMPQQAVPVPAGGQGLRQPASNPQVQRTTVDSPGAPRKPEVIDDDDDDDADDEEGVAAAGQGRGTIEVSVRSAAAVATKGQDLYVAIIVNGNAEISSAHISLGYDSNVLEVRGVRDGGLLRAGGANPELQFTADGGMLNVQMDRPMGSPGVPARGQLLLVIFTVKGQGQAPLTLNEEQTIMRTPNGQVVPVRLVNTQVEVR
jgi:general secretion pathway protein D